MPFVEFAFREPEISGNPTTPMKQFDFFEPIHPNWFATVRTIENGELVEEEWFDSLLTDMEYVRR